MKERTALALVRNTGDASPPIHTPATGAPIIVRIEAAAPVETPDELRPVTAWAAQWGLEVSGLRTALRRSGARLVRVGRATCVRRSEVLALADRQAAEPGAPPEDAEAAYRAMVRRAGR
jgi:hypothetical protein